MREKLRRYGKQVMVYICTFVILAGSVFSFSFESKAANYTISMSRPDATTNSGYVELLVRDRNSGVIYVSVYFWNCYGVDGNKTVDVFITPDELTLSAFYGGTFTIFNISSDGRDNPAIVSNGDSAIYTFNSKSFNQEIFGYRVYGNVGGCNSSIGGYIADWTVLYSDEATEVYELTQIYSQLVQANANDTTMINKINQIYNSLDTVESKLQQLIDLQEDSNTWLEKIWNSIQEFLGKEPAEDAAPPVDEDNMLGSMEETEDALFPDTSEAEQSLNVQLNSGFSVLTWLVESFAKMDAGVFSMFLTMLTFGVMALLLGR